MSPGIVEIKKKKEIRQFEYRNLWVGYRTKLNSRACKDRPTWRMWRCPFRTGCPSSFVPACPSRQRWARWSSLWLVYEASDMEGKTAFEFKCCSPGIASQRRSLETIRAIVLTLEHYTSIQKLCRMKNKYVSDSKTQQTVSRPFIILKVQKHNI